ncbi:MAG: BamA/TamA family outer membrane protein [Saprospiraceae bacterium]
MIWGEGIWNSAIKLLLMIRAKAISKYIPTFSGLSILLLFLSSCNTKKYLDVGDAFLSKNKIQISGDFPDKNALKDDLESLFKQRPTSYQKRWFYYKTKGRLQRRFGEQPTIWSNDLSDRTAQSMLYMLQNKSYYKAKVTFDKKIKNHKVQVSYSITLNKPYVIDSIFFLSKDENIQKIMNGVKDESFFKVGTPVEAATYRKEVGRLTRVIRDFGYANFNGNYFAPLDADTTSNKAIVRMVALTPNDSPLHQKYHIGKIKVLANYSTDNIGVQNVDTSFQEILFSAPFGIFPIQIRTLRNCIAIQPQREFRQSNIDATYRKFENLGAFRLINIKTEFSQQNKQEVDVLITLVQYDKRSFTSNFELNTTQGGTIGLGTNVGISASVNLRNNNVFGKAEKSNTSLEFGVQGLFDSDNSTNFYETSLQQDFAIPKFNDPLLFWKTLNNIKLFKTKNNRSGQFKILSDVDYINLKERASTKFTGGFKYILSQPIQYLQINANFGYGIPLSPTSLLSINQLSLEFLSPLKLAPPISDNEFLKRLFGQQFVTSVFFKDFNFSSKFISSRSTGWSRKFRFRFEQSGLEIFAVNKLYDVVSNTNSAFIFFNSDYSRFFRSELDLAMGRNLGRNHSIHLHTNIGGALPYGYKNTVVPYVKQYFVGGPTSMRGWQPRELGPGGREIPASGSTYYSTGDIKMEMNAEYRFGIWWIFKSALFLDAGNVWALYKNASNDNGNLRGDFYKQIAIAAGTGLRIDFDYSVIRIDLAYRLRYPYPDATGSYWNFKSPTFKKWNLTFGLDYPF